jgi:hypothetical protein
LNQTSSLAGNNLHLRALAGGTVTFSGDFSDGNSIASWSNPVMVDGTGMCGGCRVSVGGQVRFACVDGPEFDAHGVDFNELWARLGTYKEQEAHVCRLKAAADAAGKQP